MMNQRPARKNTVSTCRSCETKECDVNVMKSEKWVKEVCHTMTNEVHGVGWCSDTEEIIGMWILAYSVSLCGEVGVKVCRWKQGKKVIVVRDTFRLTR